MPSLKFGDDLRLVFLQIFSGHVILGNLVRVNLSLISVPGVFYASHRVGLERIPFFEQLINAL
jgi:hypothetical protein